ncbi:hypothetical protein M2271_004356 [Streptomyces sp. LBL]|uniref:hypothetical protein n=1 Tax=Streptomyces sp. LBL TaxID=2940562 RepID=UPI002477194D|nr:hypothetical protein [Streptomyces sp. LBL]MDH6626539.1 hypothetical protein [Streptomyces sp. LBL]
MPRGRHRHSPPLHRLLPPSAIAGVSLVCALGPWLFTDATVLRGLAVAAAATAIGGAVVLRHWDTQAGKQVAELTRARASDEWRYEERVAELETDLEESRGLRGKLEQRLRAKRSELAGLRNEHAALLRRYATAETERASALEGRRLLEIEASVPAPALLPAQAGSAAEAEAAAAPADPEAEVAEDRAETAERVRPVKTGETGETGEKEPEAPPVFSPDGSQLFLRAKGALARFDEDGGDDGDGTGKDSAEAEPEDSAEAEADEAEDANSRNVRHSRNSGSAGNARRSKKSRNAEASKDVTKPDPKDAPEGVSKGAPNGAFKEVAKAGTVKVPAAGGPAAGAAATSQTEAAQEDEAQGKSEAVDGHQRAAATPSAKAAQPAQQATGHFVAPTAVAVVPPTPVRRPSVEGGFDFFGMQQGAEPAALEAVQNEDLADVVGQEALALHKAESEAQFKPADEASRGVGQVIDLTAHDETQHIDLQGLRTAVS